MSAALAANRSAAWQLGSRGSSRHNRPSIGSRGGMGGGDQPGNGKPTGWPRSFRVGSISVYLNITQWVAGAHELRELELVQASGLRPRGYGIRTFTQPRPSRIGTAILL